MIMFVCSFSYFSLGIVIKAYRAQVSLGLGLVFYKH